LIQSVQLRMSSRLLSRILRNYTGIGLEVSTVGGEAVISWGEILDINRVRQSILEFSGAMQSRNDRLCGLVASVPRYRSRGPGSIPGATRFSEK
jgi:hypothetical protein